MKKVMELETPGKRLRAIRSYCAPSRNSFCTATNLSESTLKAWENDVARLTRKGARALVEMFQGMGVPCTKDWLLEGKTPSPLRSLEENQISGLSEEKFILSEFERLSQYYEKPLLFQSVADQSMAPLFKAGDFVAGCELNLSTVPYYWDDIILVKTAEHGMVLRKIQKGGHPGFVTLETTNLPEGHPDARTEDVELLAAYKIVWHRSPLSFRAKKPSERNLRRAI